MTNTTTGASGAELGTVFASVRVIVDCSQTVEQILSSSGCTNAPYGGWGVNNERFPLVREDRLVEVVLEIIKLNASSRRSKIEEWFARKNLRFATLPELLTLFCVQPDALIGEKSLFTLGSIWIRNAGGKFPRRYAPRVYRDDRDRENCIDLGEAEDHLVYSKDWYMLAARLT